MATPRARLPVANIELVRQADDLLGEISFLLEPLMGDAPMTTDGRVSLSARALARVNKARLLLREATQIGRTQ